MLSRFSGVQLFATLWTVTCQVPVSMGFSRQEYWSGLQCPPPEDLSNPGSNPGPPHCRQIINHLSHLGNPIVLDMVKSDTKEAACVNFLLLLWGFTQLMFMSSFYLPQISASHISKQSLSGKLLEDYEHIWYSSSCSVRTGPVPSEICLKPFLLNPLL